MFRCLLSSRRGLCLLSVQKVRDEITDWDSVWFKFTRMFKLKSNEAEILQISDKSWATSGEVIGWQICSSDISTMKSDILGLANQLGVTKVYVNDITEAVESQAQKFFKEFDKEDKGMKIN